MFNGRAVLCLLLGTILTSCSAGPEPAADSADEETRLLAQSDALQQSLYQAALPANTSNIQELKTVSFYFCSFTIGTAEQAPPYPPQRLVWLRRQAVSGRVCPGGFIVLGSSYGVPTVDLVRHPFLPALAASFTNRVTPSGSAHTQLQIVQPSYATGAILHRATLAAMAPSSAPYLGNVLAGDLSLELDGTLNVTGQKNGLITPSESPPGALNYLARYRFFLFDPNPQPTPSEISTF